MAHVLERRRTPCRILEIIAPGGFESYFDELVDDVSPRQTPAPAWLADLVTRYGFELDIEVDPRSVERFGLTFG